MINNNKLAIITLGCAKNHVDSDIMTHLLTSQNYELVDDLGEAEIIIINTCGFIEIAKQESIDKILEIADYKEDKLKVLIVAGCLAERYAKELQEEIEEIDAIIGTGDFDQIANVIDEVRSGLRPAYTGHKANSYEEYVDYYNKRSAGASAYIKIAEGCDNNCTFCIIPKLRGSYRSRSIESIVSEVRNLAQQGTKEVNLVAQDSSIYGHDIYDKVMIVELLEELNNIDGIEWIRLLYTYPSFLSDELIDAIARLDKVCKYVEIPLQHSEDRLLKLMNRPDKKSEIVLLLQKLRERIPNITIRTTLIVGFPSESEEEFTNLKEFVRSMEFDRLGAFAYSREEGTPADKLPGHLRAEVKEARLLEINHIQEKIIEKRNSRLLNKVLPVIVEGKLEDNLYSARTIYDAPEIDGMVTLTSGGELEIGNIYQARINHVLDYDFAGEVVLK